MADYRGMVVWQKADNLAIRVYQLTQEFPPEEKYGLTSQIRRAVVSVPANIAEGAGRQTLKDFRQFLYNARGSLHEVEYYIHLSQRLGYLSDDFAQSLEDDRGQVAMALQGLIKWADRELAQGRTIL